jgi:hypothetical protein
MVTGQRGRCQVSHEGRLLARGPAARYARAMAIKNTILGWLRSTPDKKEELEEAEADELTREYSSDRADSIAESRFRSRPGEFEGDQDGPRH